MNARLYLQNILEQEGIRFVQPTFQLQEPDPLRQASKEPFSEISPPKVEKKWIVGSLRGMKLNELYDDGMTLFVLEGRVEDPRTLAMIKRRIGVVGANKPETYPVGTVVREIVVDSMRGGPGTYRRLGGYGANWKVIGHGKATDEEARRMRLRALYHFD